MKADAWLNRLQSIFGKIRQFGRRLDFGAGFYERSVDGAESEFQFLILSRRLPAFTEFHRHLFLTMLKFSLRRERFLQPALQPAQLGVHRLNNACVTFAEIDAVANLTLASAQKEIDLGKERAERVELSARCPSDDLKSAITADDPGYCASGSRFPIDGEAELTQMRAGPPAISESDDLFRCAASSQLDYELIVMILISRRDGFLVAGDFARD